MQHATRREGGAGAAREESRVVLGGPLQPRATGRAERIAAACDTAEDGVRHDASAVLVLKIVGRGIPPLDRLNERTPILRASRFPAPNPPRTPPVCTVQGVAPLARGRSLPHPTPGPGAAPRHVTGHTVGVTEVLQVTTEAATPLPGADIPSSPTGQSRNRIGTVVGTREVDRAAMTSNTSNRDTNADRYSLHIIWRDMQVNLNECGEPAQLVLELRDPNDQV